MVKTLHCFPTIPNQLETGDPGELAANYPKQKRLKMYSQKFKKSTRAVKISKVESVQQPKRAAAVQMRAPRYV